MIKMNGIPIESMILAFVVVSTIIAVAFFRKLLIKPRKTKLIRKEKEYTFQEASKNSDVLFRCGNPECRAFFSEPKIVDNFMTNGIDPSKRYYVQGASKRSYVCPKCGVPLKTEEVKKEIG